MSRKQPESTPKFAYRDLERIVDNLDGRSSSWDITIGEPNRHEPNGRVTITHESFNKCTEVVVTSAADNGEFTYHVHHMMETDILTHADDVSFTEAVWTAVEVANKERRRQCWYLPPYNVSNPIRYLCD
jgi:hypothetical protein